MSERTCLECDTTVTGRPDKVYCSAPCGKRAAKRREMERGHGCTCVQCGGTFRATIKRARYCSPTCEGEAKRWRYARKVTHLTWQQCPTCGWWRPRGRWCPKRAAHPVEVRTAPPFDCPICGKHVVPGSDGVHWQRRIGCSLKCRQAIRNRRPNARAGRTRAKARRRAAKKGAYVADVYRLLIFERDGWRCQLCGGPLARSATVPHPRAPTIDHILPLAVGGTHEPANAQAAHFLCNSLKGDRPANDQLRLLG